MKTVLAPHQLGGGLFNQIRYLAIYVAMARQHNYPLAVPPLTASVTSPRGADPIPFGTMFSFDCFAAAVYAALGVTVLEEPQENATLKIPRFADATKLFVKRGYIIARGLPPDRNPYHQAEQVTLLALRSVSSGVREHLEEFWSVHGKDYGCLHARIEKDMKQWWRNVKGGYPPTLALYMQAIQSRAELNGTSKIFVAVGDDVSAADNATLQQPTPWGAEFVRSRNSSEKSSYHRNRNRGSLLSYAESALLDFELCRHASWFVGWPGSSFATAVASRRALERSEANHWYYSVCMNRKNATVERRADGGVYPCNVSCSECGGKRDNYTVGLLGSLRKELAKGPGGNRSRSCLSHGFSHSHRHVTSRSREDGRKDRTISPSKRNEGISSSAAADESMPAVSLSMLLDSPKEPRIGGITQMLRPDKVE